MINLSSCIDHTLLKPTASESDIRKCCEEAWIYQFKAVCIAPTFVAYTKEMLEFCPVKIEIATVIGFPFGYSTTAAKRREAEIALKHGATELDVVMNLSQFKSMAYLSIREELKQLAELVHENDAILKVTIETAYLDSFDLYTACEICAEAKADFVNTSTGFAPSDADAEMVRKLRSILPPDVQIKASGRIQGYAQASEMMEAGASRIGTSFGLALMNPA
jgi:deoxyribose-phosphate aldolase